jgi:hypothetical protein
MNCRVRRIQRSRSAWLVVCIATLVAAGSATADFVLHDDLDDGALDAAWQVSFQDAWRNERGCRYAFIGANYLCNYNELPHRRFRWVVHRRYLTIASPP